MSDRESLRSLSWPLIDFYCKRRGWDFITKTEPYVTDRHPSWSKLLLLKELLPLYDVVIWVDDDIVFTQPTVKFEDLIRPFLDSDKPLAVSENNSTPFNFGLIVVKNTAGEIIDQIWNNIDEETRFGLFWEESAAERLYKTDETFRNKIYIVPPAIIQGFHPANCNVKYKWYYKTFALHVSGFKDIQYRIKLMKQAIDELRLESRHQLPSDVLHLV